MSLAVSAGAVRPPPWRLMPLLFDSSPPTLTVVWTSSPTHRIDVSTIRPSLSSSMSPGSNVARQLLVVEADALAGCPARRSRRRARTCSPATSIDLAAFELADADFRALQVGHDGDLLADLRRHLAHQRGAVDVVLRLAVREIEPHHVDAGADHALEHLGRLLKPGRWWRRSWCAGMRTVIGSNLLVIEATVASVSVVARRRRSRISTRRQRLAFQEFEECAAAGRDVADLVGDAVLGDRRERVAAAGDRERRRTAAMARASVLVPSPNWSNSNTPTGPFQTIVPAVFSSSASAARRVFGPMSRIMSSSATSADGLDGRHARRPNSLGA